MATASHPLIGRENELARLRELLEKRERVVTVLGPPGVGKTALALALAEEMPPGGSIVCDLSGVHTDAELEPAVARALDEASEAARSVPDLLAERGACLLVLDNFEQIVTAGHRLTAWLRDAPRTQLLVTSRERLALSGECVFEVPPLAEGDAVRLFQARTRDVGLESADDPTSVAAIVRALDGLPLAIELAAARRRLFSTRELATRLADLRESLGWAQRQPDRHRSLEHAIAWSWGLLTEVEQRALAGCSVFASTFEASDAVQLLQPVLDPSGSAGLDLGETLMALRDKSLLQGTRDGRLRMYASVRAYAGRALTDLGADFERSVHRHHASMIAVLARDHIGAALDLSVDAQPAILQRALRHRDDIVVALGFAAEAGWIEPRVDLACSAAIIPALSVASAHRALDEAQTLSSDPEGTARIGLARHRLGAMHGDPTPLEELERIADDPRVSGALRESALLVAGVQRRSDGDSVGALRCHDRLAEHRIEGGQARIHAINLACRGRLLGDLECFDAAIEVNEDAVAACERMEQWWLAALALANMAQIEQERGHFERAQSLLQRAVERFREADQGRYEGVYSAVHGNLHLEQAELEEACRWYAAGEGFLDKMLSTYPTLVLYGGRAMAEALAGRTTEADVYIERARRAVVRVPGTVGQTLVQAHAAVVTLAAGRADDERRRRWRHWVDTLRDPPTVAANLDVRFALRILARALEPASHARVALTVEDGGRRLRIDGHDDVDLGRRATLRRLVLALAEQHNARPGTALSVETLVERGWPAQTILPEAARTRLRVAISTLRKLGLRAILLTRDDGYLFDPAVRIEAVRRPHPLA